MVASTSLTLKDHFQRSRLRTDFFIIWGHGLANEDLIIDTIHKTENIRIQRFHRLRPKSMNSVIEAVYNFDYAPIEHLRYKIKYLKKVPKELLFIFVQNIAPDESGYGEGAFRHLECNRIKAVKNAIRDRFNPKDQRTGLRTEDHVIHSSDNSRQTQQILAWLGYKEGILPNSQQVPFFFVPEYLPTLTSTSVEYSNLDDLHASIATGSRWKFEVQQTVMHETPHFKSLQQADKNIYLNYIKRYRGTALKEAYSVARYEALLKTFRPENQDPLIVSINSQGKKIILDGLHRAAIARYLGHKKILISFLEAKNDSE